MKRHPNNRGGDNPFYQSTAWKRARRQALERDGWACVLCGASVRGKGRARVDHIHKVEGAPHLALEVGNMRTLCTRCDAIRHSRDRGPGRSRDAEAEQHDNGGMSASWRAAYEAER
ncbi:HNH endonuclease [Ruegeria arenilitoris]|uniref:HNH endonuclease n=1 Tax=Ruegeria arenilitoris TaxID=1173585 RepID=UPI00147FE52A